MRISLKKEWRGSDVRVDFADMDFEVRAISDSYVADTIALPEIALSEEIIREDMEGIEERERLYNPSDLQDVGDPEGTDVGVPFGLAAGGAMGEGGRDYDEASNDLWGSSLNPAPPAGDMGSRFGF